MGKNQEIFLYTNEQLEDLVATLSTDRFDRYLNEATGDRWLAVKLYEWNASLSESLYGVLQGLEVALRNSFHRTLSAAFNRNDWYDIQNLLAVEQQESIRKAKARIVNDGKTVCPARVVAELTFGFWVSLTGPTYAQTLWDQHLYKSLTPNLSRKAAHRRLEKIRKLRNRVAHHESILARNLKSDYSGIIETLHWICPTTAQWIKSISSFHPRFSAKPQPPQQQVIPLSATS